MTEQQAAAVDGTGFDAETLEELRVIMARYPQPRSALLPMLHLLQSVEGRVTARGIETCAALLGISAAEVSGVATFYTMFKRRPVGDYHVGVCTNTLCAVMGGDEIFERLKDHLGVGNDETTQAAAGGRTITLEHLECNAACDYAPVMMVNWEFMDNMTPRSAIELVDDLGAGKPVRSTRGPEICSWREAERILAGFPDDRVDDGPAGGPATMLGLRIARENDWKAPQAQGAAAGETGTGTGASEEQATVAAGTSQAEADVAVEEAPTERKGGKGSEPEADGKDTEK